MKSWCAYKALAGCGTFLSQHADEEMMHRRHLWNSFHETGALAILGGMEAPPSSFVSLHEMFEKSMPANSSLLGKINDLVHLDNTEPDYSTLQFWQWYVAELHQEEFLCECIPDKIVLIGAD